MEIYEIFDAVESVKSREEKMEVLVNNDCLALRDILKINFDSNLTIHVSKKLSWTPSVAPTNSLKDITKFLVPLSKGNVEQDRADASFVALLESVHPMDAQILTEAVAGKLKVKGLTSKLIKGVWGERIIS